MSREEFYRGFQSVNGSYGVSVRDFEGGGFPWRLFRFISKK